MNAAIFGIGPDNYNFKKIEGVAKGFFELGYDRVQTLRGEDLRDYNEKADVAFIESDVSPDCDLSKFKKVIVWQNWTPSRIIQLAAKFKDTNFTLAVKSPIHSRVFKEEYRKTFKTNEYLRCDETHEVIDLGGCDLLNKPVQKIADNVTYAYAPCSLSSDSRYVERKDIDVCYFGTLNNRPGVVEVLRALPKNLNVAAHFVEKSGPIHPEVCVSLYRRAKVCLHEQVSPVWGEFPVRFGESTAQGCRVISLSREFDLSRMINDSLVPDHDSSRTVDGTIGLVTEWLEPRKEERQRMRDSAPKHSDMLRRALGQ